VTINTASAAANPPLACGNCGQPMSSLKLAGHYGQSVEIDCCAPCHLLWFDTVESVRLTGASMLELIGAMAAAQQHPHQTLSTKIHCPRCQGGLKLIHNQTRWGSTRQLECFKGHGIYQTFAQFLSEKGLLRALTAMDRTLLLRQGQVLHCLNCGALLPSEQETAYATTCRYCDSLPALLDIARLARAVDPEGATARDPEHQAAHRVAAQHRVFNCHACGAALADEHALSCSQCGATQVGTGLQQAHLALRGMTPALHRHASKPVPHVVAQRLGVLRQDTAKRRDWVREMEASTNARRDDASASHWLARLLGDRFDSDTTRQWESIAAWLLFAALIGWWLGWFDR
jgi:Zn-finger nucleic acid-binding protein/ribosomal protein L40E